jgi:hypothetical protein
MCIIVDLQVIFFARLSDKLLLLLLLIYLFIYIANGGLLGGSGATITRNTQITHVTQNNTPHSNRNTAHKTTQTIKDTLYTMSTM